MGKKPVYLLAGGRGSDNTPLFKVILNETSKPNPLVAYVGVANNDDKRFFEFMRDQITKSGKCILKHAVLKTSDDVSKSREILEQADAIFVSGGDVDVGVQVLQSLTLIPFFRELYESGKIFSGASAGSIMLSKEWVRWTDPDNDSSAEIFPCMNIAPVVIDTHAEEDDWGELKAALKLEKPETRGYGIPSGACLKIDSSRSIEALGHSIAHFVRTKAGIIRLGDIPVR